jgi:hypothetical protein
MLKLIKMNIRKINPSIQPPNLATFYLPGDKEFSG